MVNPVTRVGTTAGRIRFRVPQQLANHLGPLATEAIVTQPTHSSDIRERLGTVSDLRGRSLENRLGP